MAAAELRAEVLLLQLLLFMNQSSFKDVRDVKRSATSLTDVEADAYMAVNTILGVRPALLFLSRSQPLSGYLINPTSVTRAPRPISPPDTTRPLVVASFVLFPSRCKPEDVRLPSSVFAWSLKLRAHVYSLQVPSVRPCGKETRSFCIHPESLSLP